METLLQINRALNSKKGIFISFEGGEGVGKSTQIGLLNKDLITKRNLFNEKLINGTTLKNINKINPLLIPIKILDKNKINKKIKKGFNF